eukprot:566380-Amphidinium_carterae.1
MKWVTLFVLVGGGAAASGRTLADLESAASAAADMLDGEASIRCAQQYCGHSSVYGLISDEVCSIS